MKWLCGEEGQTERSLPPPEGQGPDPTCGRGKEGRSGEGRGGEERGGEEERDGRRVCIRACVDVMLTSQGK